jgi:F0F1-type ATP synthase membrane subunit c/vacuolar-type H+-ATPase subunit K
MQYAERLPTTKTLLAPVLALAVGAAAATGAYAVLDSETMVVGKPEVIVAEVPAPGTVAETKNEAAIAAGIAVGAAGTGAETKNEAAIAAGISAGTAEDALARGNDLKAPGARTN